MEKENFIIEIDGINKKANALNIVTIDGKRYLIYSVDNNNDDNRIRRKKVSSNDYNYKYKQHQRYYKEKVRIDNTSYERKIENNKWINNKIMEEQEMNKKQIKDEKKIKR